MNLSEKEYGASVWLWAPTVSTVAWFQAILMKNRTSLWQELGMWCPGEPRDPSQELKGTFLDLVFWRVLSPEQERRVLQETWHCAMVRVTGLAQPWQCSALSGLKGHICVSKWSTIETSPAYGGQGERESLHPWRLTPPWSHLGMALGILCLELCWRAIWEIDSWPRSSMSRTFISIYLQFISTCNFVSVTGKWSGLEMSWLT